MSHWITKLFAVHTVIKDSQFCDWQLDPGRPQYGILLLRSAGSSLSLYLARTQYVDLGPRAAGCDPRATWLRITPSLFMSLLPETDRRYFHPTFIILRTWLSSWTYFSKPLSQHEVLVRVQVRVKMPASKPAGSLHVVTACSWSQDDILNCLRTPRNPLRWWKLK